MSDREEVRSQKHQTYIQTDKKYYQGMKGMISLENMVIVNS